jgi:amino acid transporter
VRWQQQQLGRNQLRKGRDVTDSREDTVTYAEEVDERPARTPGRTVLSVVLVIIGILAIIAAVIYFTTDAKSLPSILGTIKLNGHNAHRANQPRSLRGVVALIVGVIVLAGGVFAFVWKPKSR